LGEWGAVWSALRRTSLYSDEFKDCLAIFSAVNMFTVDKFSQPVVTLRAIARRAGLSLATVSYALRAHPKISPATRKLVATAAIELGYRHNSRVAGLMAHIRGANVRPRAERIAFVWVQTSRRVAAENSYLRAVFDGAVARAKHLGFVLEEFWTNDAGMKDSRLQEIILARGISGVLLSPVLSPVTSLALDWDWSRLAAVVIGNVTWTPELHHVGHHHFSAMRTVVLELVKLGCTRPAAVVDAVIDERAKHAWTGAFFANHPEPERARQLLHVHDARRPRDLAAWLRGSGADALIVSAVAHLSAPGVRAVCRQKELQVATLRWSATLPANIAGIDQCDELIGAQAVELLIAQLNQNERGPPRHPGMMLFPGQWIETAVARVC
jgi:DNA-binding LacI/PurR family transcriptional regulator